MEKANKAIIMAAGLGSRLAPVTNHIPKPMVEVNGVRMIDTIIDALHKNGIEEIHIVVGYLKDEFKKLNKKYYYFEPDYRMAKNKIVGSVSKGYYYVDKTGVRVTSDEVRMAVRFVTANSSRKSRQREQLRQCFDALRRYPYLNKGDTPPKASQLPSYARFMFTSKCGDCYYYGVTMAYIARVLGYDSRVAAGGVTAWGPTYPLSPHGWCEVRKGTEWKMMDCSMQNGHPDANLFFVTRKQYPYRLRCDKIYALNISDGKVTWR